MVKSTPPASPWKGEVLTVVMLNEVKDPVGRWSSIWTGFFAVAQNDNLVINWVEKAPLLPPLGKGRFLRAQMLPEERLGFVAAPCVFTREYVGFEHL